MFDFQIKVFLLKDEHSYFCLHVTLSIKFTLNTCAIFLTSVQKCSILCMDFPANSTLHFSPLAADGRSLLSERAATLRGRDHRPNSITRLSHCLSLSPLPNPLHKVPSICISPQTIGTHKLHFWGVRISGFLSIYVLRFWVGSSQ